MTAYGTPSGAKSTDSVDISTREFSIPRRCSGSKRVVKPEILVAGPLVTVTRASRAPDRHGQAPRPFATIGFSGASLPIRAARKGAAPVALSSRPQLEMRRSRPRFFGLAGCIIQPSNLAMMSDVQKFSKRLICKIVARKTIGTDEVKSEILALQLKQTEACNLFSNPLLVLVR